MTNLDLHNKLLALAKQIQELKDKHPELADYLHPIEESLVKPKTATPGRQG